MIDQGQDAPNSIEALHFDLESIVAGADLEEHLFEENEWNNEER